MCNFLFSGPRGEETIPKFTQEAEYMLLNHDITIDLTNPGPVPRLHVKQGDAMSRNIRI